MAASTWRRGGLALAVAVAAATSIGHPAVARAESRGASSPLPLVQSGGGGPFSAPAVPGSVLTSGSMFVGFRGTDGQTVGAVATVTPWRASFLKLGAEATPRSRDGAVRFLWGLGFESARDNTLYAHLHDWGPVRPADEFTIRHTQLEAGYKLPRLCGGPLCLATSVFGALPFSELPYGGPRLTVTAARRWYAAIGVGHTIPGVREDRGPAGWRLDYAFGRWDWRPGTLFVAYRDALSLVRMSDVETSYRQGKGVLTAGMTWAH